MADTPEGRLYRILPREFVQRLARAAEAKELTMVLVLSEEVQGKLRANRPAMIEMENGSVVVLIPQERLMQTYAGKERGRKTG